MIPIYKLLMRGNLDTKLILKDTVSNEILKMPRCSLKRARETKKNPTARHQLKHPDSRSQISRYSWMQHRGPARAASLVVNKCMGES